MGRRKNSSGFGCSLAKEGQNYSLIMMVPSQTGPPGPVEVMMRLEYFSYHQYVYIKYLLPGIEYNTGQNQSPFLQGACIW